MISCCIHRHAQMHSSRRQMKMPPSRRKQKQYGHGRAKSNADGQHVSHVSAGSSIDMYGKRHSKPRSAGKNGAQTLRNTSGACTSANSDNQGENDLEIPGFYYDKVKKKYFRILPGHNNQTSGCITRQVVAQRKAEEKRQADLDIQKYSGVVQGVQFPLRKSIQISKVFQILSHLERGELSPISACYRCAKARLQTMKISSSCKIFNPPHAWNEKLEHMTTMLVDTDCRRIVCVWSLSQHLMQRLQVMDISNNHRINENIQLSINPGGAPVFQSLNKISGLCHAYLSESSSPDGILYTTTCFLGNSPSMALLRQINPNEDARLHTKAEFSLGDIRSTWCCAWNTQLQEFSVGTERHGLVVDVNSRSLWEVNTRSQDVFTQTFSHQTGQLLYSGTQRGMICAHDRRSKSTRPVWGASHSACVCHLHLGENDIHLTAADITGKLQLWDVRNNSKPVIAYKDHCNTFKRLPFQVDEKNQFLIAVGQDSYTRIWDRQKGTLLRSVPPPRPACEDFIPNACLSDNVGGPETGFPGLLMGLADKLYVYH